MPTATAPRTPWSATSVAAEAALAALAATEQRIHDVLSAESARWASVDVGLPELPALLDAYVRRGGKRLRPSFLFAGVVAAGGEPNDATVVDTAAALELLHAFALIHDDVMDGSTTRRGQPALHVQLATDHALRRGRGESRRFGEGLAVLAGDLALVYADRLAPLEPSVRAIWDELRIELTMGQFLDVNGAGLGTGDQERSRRIATLKSGRYTIVRPLHLAAAVARRRDLEAPFAAFGEPLGRAFQMCDDVLGAFGEPEATGKPVGDDLREAKPTLLLELARERATGPQASVLAAVGRPDLTDDDVVRIRGVLAETGALAAVKAEIARDEEVAATALAAAPITEDGRQLLGDLARTVVDRDR